MPHLILEHSILYARLLLLLTILAPVAGAQAVPTPPPSPAAADSGATLPLAAAPRIAVAARINGVPPPELDGRLDDEAWQHARPLDGFIQRQPDEGKEASESTEARILYDDVALYVGIRARDREPDRIVGLLTRRDEWSESDWLSISIDSFGDRRTAFEFDVNPAGVERDIYRYDDNSEDDSWDAVWEVATHMDDEGWSAEYRIPFSQLRFASNPDRPWGLQVSRWISRRNEHALWKPIPRSGARWVSEYGELKGVEQMTPPRRLELLPYTLGGGEISPREDGNPFADGHDFLGRAGLDLKYGVTSDITLDAAFNPDFGQVEADPSVINLSQFETFFPEKRPFFLEGTDKFYYTLTLGDGNAEPLFYSRRVGRAPQGDPGGDYVESPTHSSIIAATKVSGKTSGGWTVGLLEAITEKEVARVQDSSGNEAEAVVEPLTNYALGRVSRDFRGGKSAVGGIFTATHRHLDGTDLNWLHSAAYAAGFDGRHRWNDAGWAVNGKLAASSVRGDSTAIIRTQRSSRRYYQRPDADHVEVDSTATDLTGSFGYLEAGKFSGTWRGALLSQFRSPDFEVNDLGFQRLADDIFNVLWFGYRQFKPGKIFREYNLNTNLWYRTDFGYIPLSRGGNVNGSCQFANYWRAWSGVNLETEVLTTRALRGGPAFTLPASWNGWAGFQTDTRKAVWTELEGWAWRDAELSFSHGGEAEVFVRVAPNVNLSLGLNPERTVDDWGYVDQVDALGERQYLFAYLDQRTLSLTSRVNWTFRPNLSLQVYAAPFLSAGKYHDFMRVVDPRAKRYDDRFDHFGEVGTGRIKRVDDNYEVDIDENGSVDLTFADPAFNFRELRSNVVLRWEYLQGSTLFLVYQHQRSDETLNGISVPFRDLGDLWDADGTHTVLLKVNYWWSL